ncbi:MAG: hypothetical protein CSB48_08870 [Proteobacteria bacterium]|nr:MAG: hypothetical protein CSB48_08870 [Pseudomonadota bacterium]PIE40438.1 MAG: hypothetical protein CSA51_00760 [Gammaproteobacteria bacterium]
MKKLLIGLAILGIGLSGIYIAGTGTSKTGAPSTPGSVSKSGTGTHPFNQPHTGQLTAKQETPASRPALNRESTQVNNIKPKGAYYFTSTEEYENVSAYGPLPGHLQQVALRKLSWDDKGNLIVEPKIKDLIESLLTGSRVEGKDTAIARITEYMTMTLPEPAASQALAILENYLEYKYELPDYRTLAPAPEGREETISYYGQLLDQRKQFRREKLGDEVAHALFGDEELYDDYSLTRISVMTDPTLTDEEKEALIIQSENTLPEAKRQQVSHKREERKLKKKIADLKSAGGNEEEIYRLRVNFYGKGAAERMRYAESSSPEWRQRVALFNQERQQIEQQTDISEEQKAELINEIKNSSFSKKEQIKMAVQNIRSLAKQ